MVATPSPNRYKLLRQIGIGDFATVYAGRDMKLGREVAVKQIHAHFLADEQKLKRYWQEAQLLVTLEHPNIITLYDVVKSHGCLVLELMQGSLKQIYADRPAPLHDIRQMLLQAAGGLHYLHGNGIIHGDIKPANLLLSRQSLVKLGDFGLAHRASDSDGSLLKGTTKYMAPELVSDQFGPVGPASDLYSLGFTALELMCGPEYDTLFPELNAYGRDQQLAWMMWHCAPDRAAPDVRTILEGVPDDLAAVLQKLTTKDQSKRYRSAAELIADLSSSGPAAAIGSGNQGPTAEELAEQKRLKRKRIGAIAAFTTSLVLCLGMLFYPTEKPAPPPAPVAPAAVHGVVKNILLNDQKLVLAVGNDWKELTLFQEDRIYLNHKQRQLRDLQVGDRVVVNTLVDPQQNSFTEIAAFRPAEHRGTIKSRQLDEGAFTLLIDAGEDAGSELTMTAASSTPITLNGQSIDLQQLADGDRVQVKHVEHQTGVEALSIEAIRVMQAEGIVRNVDLQHDTLTIATGADSSQLVTLPWDDQIAVTLNGLRFLDKQILKPRDIRPGDQVAYRYDTRILSLDAQRLYRDSGTLSHVGVDSGTITLRRTGDAESSVFTVPPEAPVTLGGEEVTLGDLRIGDAVKLTHDSPGATTPAVLALEATRTANPRKWALLIANDTFEDSATGAIPHALGDAQLLRDRLIGRYAVPPDQAVLLANESRVRLEQAIPPLLAKIPADAELYVYLTTNGYAVPGDNVYLAPRDFSAQRMKETAWKLDWLIDQLDACKVGRKLLLLDCSHAPAGVDRSGQASTAEMLELLKSTHEGGYPRSLHVLASNQAGEGSAPQPGDGADGLFATCLAKAFAGGADKQRDNQIEFTELSEFVARCMTSEEHMMANQSPRFFLPDDTPPRLTEAAKQAIGRLLAQFSQSKIDPLTIQLEAEQADRLAGGQPEPMLACGYLLLKSRQWDRALEVLEGVRLAHPTNMLAHQGIVWIHFNKRDYAAGIANLQTMLDQIPVPEQGEAGYDPYTLALFQWSGQLREMAMSATWGKPVSSPAIAEATDQAVTTRGGQPLARYEQGRQQVQQVLAGFEKQLQDDPDSFPQVNLDRRNLSKYASFAPEVVAVMIRNGLDQ